VTKLDDEGVERVVAADAPARAAVVRALRLGDEHLDRQIDEALAAALRRGLRVAGLVANSPPIPRPRKTTGRAGRLPKLEAQVPPAWADLLLFVRGEHRDNRTHEATRGYAGHAGLSDPQGRTRADGAQLPRGAK
jgi:hypothetical protein